jgi:mono/diheme cytochrome c family protein
MAVGHGALASRGGSIYRTPMLRAFLLAIVLGAAVDAAVDAAEPPSGAQVYAERCSGCHGDHGAGDGPAADALVPKPRNFRDATFWRDRTFDQLRGIVKKGKPGTMMPGFDGVLTDAEMDAVTRFVQGFDPGAAK